MESADELLAIVDEAKGRRSTHATDVNASSSRSHAVLRITVVREKSHAGDAHATCSISSLGRLTLVDCAGRYARLVHALRDGMVLRMGELVAKPA